MGANSHIVELQLQSKTIVDAVDRLSRGQATCDIGLVRHHYETKSGCAQLGARLFDVGEQLGLSDRRRNPVDHVAADEHAVTVEEGGLHVSRPACASASIESNESRKAKRVSRRQRQPRLLRRSVDNRTIGTSPFHPRSSVP